jgi:asparagine synthase (glutamine-hydrolysing)
MSGFSGIYLFDHNKRERLSTFSFPENIRGYYSKSQYDGRESYKVQWYRNNKFINDGVFRCAEQMLFAFDGVSLSDTKFTLVGDWESYLKTIKSSHGTFSSFFIDKKENKLALFADQTASRQLFYYWDPHFFAFSSSIFLLTDILRHFGVQPTISLQASYMMLSLGYLMEDHTLVSEIRKVKGGHYVVADESGVLIKKYHDYYRPTVHNKITNELLTELNDRYRASVVSEYEKDVSNGYNHISTLSGGLDTRLNVLFAEQNGYKNITCVTYSEGFKSDELIARRITNDFSFSHLVLLLNKGVHLYDIDTPLVLNNGAVAYFGASHTLAAVKRICFGKYGLLHNGMLAESSKGTYLSSTSHESPSLDRNFCFSQKLFDRLDKTLLQRIFDRYATYEMFLTYNRGFNAAHNGSWMTLPYTSSVYTYMDPHFTDLAYAIHPKLRFDGYLTIEWMKKFNRASCNYAWHRGIRPTNDPLKIFMSRISYRMKMMMTGKRDVAFPVNEWYESNPTLRNFIDEQFNNAIAWDFVPNDISNEMRPFFAAGTVEEKLLCISYLKSIELLFNPLTS